VAKATMSPIPTKIERSAQQIEITWSDDMCLTYRPVAVRKACPCAICREKKAGDEQSAAKKMALPVLSKAETLPLEILKMEPVGNYAYNIHFSDGHNSGIFTFDLLYSIGSHE